MVMNMDSDLAQSFPVNTIFSESMVTTAFIQLPIMCYLHCLLLDTVMLVSETGKGNTGDWVMSLSLGSNSYR